MTTTAAILTIVVNGIFMAILTYMKGHVFNKEKLGEVVDQVRKISTVEERQIKMEKDIQQHADTRRDNHQRTLELLRDLQATCDKCSAFHSNPENLCTLGGKKELWDKILKDLDRRDTTRR